MRTDPRSPTVWMLVLPHAMSSETRRSGYRQILPATIWWSTAYVGIANCNQMARRRLRALRLLWSPSHRQQVEGLAHSSVKVAFREGATGAGLQVAFEINSSLLVRKLDGDVKSP